jgi:hypothetical protein
MLETRNEVKHSVKLRVEAGGTGGGMNPIDLERVPGKRPLKSARAKAVKEVVQ